MDKHEIFDRNINVYLGVSEIVHKWIILKKKHMNENSQTPYLKYTMLLESPKITEPNARWCHSAKPSLHAHIGL
jgi:hypothetical protein